MDKSASEHAQTTTALKTTQTQRAQLTHSLRDVGMWNKPKMKAYRMRFGHLARVWYDDMIDALSGATNATIETDLALGMALEIGLQNGAELLEYCLQRELLISESPETVSSRRVIEDQEKLAASREKYREKHRRSTGAAPDKLLSTTEGSTGEVPENRVPVPELMNNEDLNKKLSSVGWNDKAQNALEVWVAHRKAKGKPLGFSEIDALILNWSSDTDGFCRAVAHHSQNGNRNLYPVPIDEQAQRGTNKPKFNTTDQIEKIMGFEIKEIGVSRK